MKRGSKSRLRVRALALTLVAVGLLALPAAGAGPVRDQVPTALLGRLSQAVQLHVYSAHPTAAPAGLQASLSGLQKQRATRARAARQSLTSFNFDGTGLPQNEESVSACHTNTDYVLGGTNDYRGFLDPEGNFTGWHFSTDGGKALANEGLLPELSIDGTVVPSGGDPVDVAGSGCSFYAADLNYTLGSDFGTEPNGVGVYRSDAATLASCDPVNKVSCWPTGKIVASTNVHGQPNPPSPEHPADFYDKPWMDVGPSGSAGEVVWVVFSDFHSTGPGTDSLDYTASLKALRCNAALTSCTAPQTLSGSDDDVQFGDVTIGPDGRTYVTWAQIIGELPGANGTASQPQTFVIKSRVAPAGSTVFGPTHVVRTVELTIPFAGTLQANSFRIATYPKNAVAQLPGSNGRRGGGTPGPSRFFVTWEECTARLLDTICEEPRIMLTYSDDQGVTWSEPQTLSQGGVNYFPTISADPTSGQVAVAWFTNRYDPFDNRQDIELLSFPADQVSTNHLRRLTPESNDPEADPILGSRFIGDYIEVFAFSRTAWVHFNANYRDVPLLGDGVPVNQQDNFLIRTGL
jgi:hypothetical protein